jgi:HlyD family secretion protein
MNSRRNGRRVIALVALAAALISVAYFYGFIHRDTQASERFRTEPVSRGDIVQTVSANGTLNPVVLVNVGTQVSGTIQKIYADFNDKVTAGQVLAELDPRLFEARLNQSRADLGSAEANLRLALHDAERARAMAARKYLSQADLDKAEETVDVARAEVARARAAVHSDETNLKYTIIRSPVSGVVVSRNVDVGQTVAASFQTPTLFRVAEDLTKMQIDTSLAEADVGGVKVGQTASFTVDAYPERTFSGTVKQIRLNPTIQQNVVTYDVVIAVENPEELFLPGMTAVVSIAIAERHDVLRVPVAALRFRPSEKVKIEGGEAGAGPGKRVYRSGSDSLHALPIRIGITDGKFAELLSDNLHENDPLVVEEIGAGSKSQGPASGFRFRPF